MKRYLCMMLAVMLLMLSGCAVKKDPGIELFKNDYFAVKEYNGERYLDFHSGSYKIVSGSSSQSGGLLGGDPITFKSVKEMKESIEQGKFTEKQMALSI